MRIRRKLALAGSLVAFLGSSSARADDKQTCVDAYSQAQTLRDAHKLLAAREQLRICSRTTCAAGMTQDCTTWLGEVETRIPSVVLVAKDGAGSVVTDVRVGMDGAVVAEKLDGRSVDVDPGQHRFSFVTGDGTKVEQPFLVVEGQKDQRVSVTVGPALSPPPPLTPMVSPTPTAVDRGPTAPVASDTASGSGSTMRTTGLVLGGAGLAGLVVGGIFGAVAVSKKSAASCDSNSYCDTGPLSDARSAATSANVSFVVGAVLAAAGVTLFLVAPRDGQPPQSATLHVGPAADPKGGGVVLGGTW